jgi:hypothetical protein
MSNEHDFSPSPDQFDKGQEEEERVGTTKYIRAHVDSLLDYINWAGRFPNQREVMQHLEDIRSLVAPPDESEAKKQP